MSTASTWWLSAAQGEQWLLAGIHNDAHPDGAVIDAGAGEPWPPPDVFVIVERDARRVRAARVVAPSAQHAPPLWYVAVAEPGAAPPAVQLVAFSSAHRPDGEVVPDVDLDAMGVRGADQVAAFRWWPESGLTHQLYVSPPWRRRGIGHKLVYAAAGFAVASGWPRLQAGGARTDDGEALARGVARIGARVPPRTESLPSMTPGD
jgi:GNAT superfamily N-acetyltransferase